MGALSFCPIGEFTFRFHTQHLKEQLVTIASQKFALSAVAITPG